MLPTETTAFAYYSICALRCREHTISGPLRLSEHKKSPTNNALYKCRVYNETTNDMYVVITDRLHRTCVFVSISIPLPRIFELSKQDYVENLIICRFSKDSRISLIKF